MKTKNAPVTLTNKLGYLLPYFIMGLFFLIVQFGALWLSATEVVSGQPPLGNPESVGHSLYFFFAIIFFSAVILFLIWIKKAFFFKAFIYLLIAVLLYSFTMAILDKTIGLTVTTQFISLVAAITLIAVLYKHPEWYVINFIGLVIAIGAAATIGASVSYVPIIVLMLLLMIYDFISVYKTKHMLTLAKGMMDMKLPLLFVIPRKWSYSFINENFSGDEDDNKAKGADVTDITDDSINASADEAVHTAAADDDVAADETKTKKRSDALFVGLGDVVIPSLLVVSATHFIAHDGWISIPSLFTIIGTLVGFAVLMYIVSKGKPQAGLPLLNTGAILGFAAGVLISGASVSISLGF